MTTTKISESIIKPFVKYCYLIINKEKKSEGNSSLEIDLEKSDIDNNGYVSYENTLNLTKIKRIAFDLFAENFVDFINGKPMKHKFDGHANCYIESGNGKGLLIDFNYETEPLPGHFPGKVGMPLLKESRMNHLGKLMFQWFYWHALLQGRDIPGIGTSMPTSGKETVSV